MIVTVSTILPCRIEDLSRIDFSGWEPFFGITEEQDYFHRSTYIAFLKSGNREKNIFISEN